MDFGAGNRVPEDGGAVHRGGGEHGTLRRDLDASYAVLVGAQGAEGRQFVPLPLHPFPNLDGLVAGSGDQVEVGREVATGDVAVVGKNPLEYLDVVGGDRHFHLREEERSV